MAESLVFHVRITLKHTKPPIWRRVAVPSDITLGQLHEVIQIVMGWENYHLHHFVLRDKSMKPTTEEMVRLFREGEPNNPMFDRLRGERHFVPRGPQYADLDLEGEDENASTLAQVCPKVKSKLLYEYDFGDGWEHTIEVQKTIDPEEGAEYPVCLAGKLACPPEDCGGVWAYYEMLDALENPDHERHDELVEWLGGDFDPQEFDLDETNRHLRALAEHHKRRASWGR